MEKFTKFCADVKELYRRSQEEFLVSQINEATDYLGIRPQFSSSPPPSPQPEEPFIPNSQTPLSVVTEYEKYDYDVKKEVVFAIVSARVYYYIRDIPKKIGVFINDKKTFIINFVAYAPFLLFLLAIFAPVQCNLFFFLITMGCIGARYKLDDEISEFSMYVYAVMVVVAFFLLSIWSLSFYLLLVVYFGFIIHRIAQMVVYTERLCGAMYLLSIMCTFLLCLNRYWVWKMEDSILWMVFLQAVVFVSLVFHSMILKLLFTWINKHAMNANIYGREMYYNRSDLKMIEKRLLELYTLKMDILNDIDETLYSTPKLENRRKVRLHEIERESRYQANRKRVLNERKKTIEEHWARQFKLTNYLLNMKYEPIENFDFLPAFWVLAMLAVSVMAGLIMLHKISPSSYEVLLKYV
ncbi:hypothetical protein NEMIN01_1579 [Nematocida minor]|uniref:uncharacterized protein n=1 Tax=Nematocida minor TaxID=1912983 RepID=UPI0022203CCC|nr:uncharacterized protein NEMIN01_1579 [Nematocida minor]KAI5191595.1 hypothetical protein NEMIN01_1579 [Nematocida minor]